MPMYNLLQTIHSLFAFIVLGILIANVLHAAIGSSGNKQFSETSRKVALFGLIFSHVQLFIGVVLYFQSPYYALLQEGMKAVMQDPISRQIAVEHPFTNILAVVLITIGHSRSKKQTADKGKFNAIFVFYLLGLVFLLSRIPYGNWLG